MGTPAHPSEATHVRQSYVVRTQSRPNGALDHSRPLAGAHGMKRKLLRFGEGFRVPFTVRQAQAAEMVIPPGGQEGDDENRHHAADQWLFVLSGRGVARVEARRIDLVRGTLLLIERGERHSVTNTGRTLLKTLSFYSPPAFKPNGGALPAGRKSPRKAR